MDDGCRRAVLGFRTKQPELFMDNTYKLILIVLTFFLALTFVESSHALEEKEIIFNGSNPTTVVLSSANPLPSRATPEVTFWGPFSVESLTGIESTNQNGTASISATLKPIAGLRINDVYSGKALIRWGESVQEVPLRIRVSDGVDFISPASGFFTFSGLGQNLAIISNLILVIVIIFLILGLAIRIRKRLEGN